MVPGARLYPLVPPLPVLQESDTTGPPPFRGIATLPIQTAGGKCGPPDQRRRQVGQQRESARSAIVRRSAVARPRRALTLRGIRFSGELIYKNDVSLWTIGGILFVTGWIVALTSWWLTSRFLESAHLTLSIGVPSQEHRTFLAMTIVQTAVVCVLVKPLLRLLTGLDVSFAAVFLVLCAGTVVSSITATGLNRLAEQTTANGAVVAASPISLFAPVATFFTCAAEAWLLRSLAAPPGASGERAGRPSLGRYWIALVVIGGAAVVASRSVHHPTPRTPSAPMPASVEVEGMLGGKIQSAKVGGAGAAVTRVSCGESTSQPAGWPDDHVYDHYTCTSIDMRGELQGWCVQFSPERERIVAFYASRSGCADPPTKTFAA